MRKLFVRFLISIILYNEKQRTKITISDSAAVLGG